MKRPGNRKRSWSLAQISVVVANTRMKGSRAVVGKGFTRTTDGSEVVGPKGLAKASKALETGGRRDGRGGDEGKGKTELFFPSGNPGSRSNQGCLARRVTRLIFRDPATQGEKPRAVTRTRHGRG